MLLGGRTTVWDKRKPGAIEDGSLHAAVQVQ
jgi:hypothetical protein